jgi:hypothetical protein
LRLVPGQAESSRVERFKKPMIASVRAPLSFPGIYGLKTYGGAKLFPVVLEGIKISFLPLKLRIVTLESSQLYPIVHHA